MTNIYKSYQKFTTDLDEHIDGLRNDVPDCRSLTDMYFSDVWRFADRSVRHLVQESMPCKATAQLWLPGQSEDSLESMADYFALEDDYDRLKFMQGVKTFDERTKKRDVETYTVGSSEDFANYDGPSFVGHSFRLQPWGCFSRDHIGNLVCVAQGDMGDEGRYLLELAGSHLDTALKNAQEHVYMAQENRTLKKELMQLEADYEAVAGGHVKNS